MSARSGLVTTHILTCVRLISLMSSQCSVLNKKVAPGETKKVPEGQKNDGEKKKADEDILGEAQMDVRAKNSEDQNNDGEKKKATEDIRAKNEDKTLEDYSEHLGEPQKDYPNTWAILAKMGRSDMGRRLLKITWKNIAPVKQKKRFPQHYSELIHFTSPSIHRRTVTIPRVILLAPVI